MPARVCRSFLVAFLVLFWLLSVDSTAGAARSSVTTVIHAYLDYTPSDWHQLLAVATRVLGDSVDQQVRPGAGQTLVITRAITWASYSDAARNVLVPPFVIPAVAPKPHPSAINPFWSPAYVRRIQAQDARRLAQWTARLEAARSATRRMTDRIRSLHVRPTRQGTDVRGALLKAADMDVPGATNWLYVASDLQAYRFNDFGRLHLPNYRVVILYLCTDRASVCRARRTMYDLLLHRAGAQSVMFYDASLAPTLGDVFADSNAAAS